MTSSVTVGELRTAAATVQRHTALRDVRLLEMSCRGANPVVEGPFDVTSDIRVRGQKTADAVHTIARYVVNARTKPSTEDRELEDAWSLTLEFLAEYVATEQGFADLADGEITAFAMLVGLTTIHPYAREAIQSTSGRMGYPPFSVDLIEPYLDPDHMVIEVTS